MVVAGSPAPEVIQGGMGVAISDWRLARAVCQAGQLGVVSGTAIDVVCTRRLADGDAGGHVRAALAAFPVPEVARWIIDSYYVEGGIAPGSPYRQVPRHTLTSSRRLLELTAAANFVEVYLAKQGHTGPVGINYLRKIELPLPAALYGAMLAGVDYVLVGAGNPAEIPALARALAEHRPVTMSVRVMGARSSDGLGDVRFDPASVVPPTVLAGGAVPASLPLPKVLAIVASNDLARALAEDAVTRPHGFVVEGPDAGGHNAPPRGPRRLDPIGQPIYDARDEVDVPALVGLGLPVWLAGAYGSPERLRQARALGAAGIQVGTAFAYCDESGFDPAIKAQVRAAVREGSLQVRADWRCSPTGFPFHVAELAGSLTDPGVAQARQPVCDLGVLRSAYATANGTVDYRCPAEPKAAYLRKGGREANMEGRVCLCNALLASAGFPQRRPHGGVEPPLVTSGDDLSVVQLLLERHGGQAYSARDVVDYLLGVG